MTENDCELVRGSGNAFRDFNDPLENLLSSTPSAAPRQRDRALS